MLPNRLTRPEIVTKWAKVLDAKDAPKIRGRWAREVTAQMLENQSMYQKQDRAARAMLLEATPVTVSANAAKWDPVMLSMVRRITPQLMHNDVVGVQPMALPTGLIFAKRSRYTNSSGDEMFINEPKTAFTGYGNGGSGAEAATDIELDPFAVGGYTVAGGMSTAVGEGDISKQITFTIEKGTVEAKTRNLKATYSHEMAQDLQNVHGMDADAELSTDAQEEMVQEMNRELVRTLYKVAKPGAQNTATPGIFDVSASGDGDGRWMVERFKTLMFQIELDANQIWFDTRRGKGNKIIVSADVGSALNQAGLLDYQSKLEANSLDIDPGKTTYAGRLNGQFDVHVDPWIVQTNFIVVCYKGEGPFDAGLFYCPYVPFMRINAIDPASGQPIMFFKTRYGMAANPFITKANGTPDGQDMTPNRNGYYRKFLVKNLI